MKNWIFLAFLSPLTTLAQEAFTLKGSFKKLAHEPAWVHIQYRVGDTWQGDSVQPRGGKYQFTGKLQEPSLARLRVVYQLVNGQPVTSRSSRDMAVVFLQPGKINVASTDSFSQVQVKGSEAHTAYRSLLDQEKPFQEKMKPLEEEYRTYSRNKDKENMARVEKSLDSLDALKNEAVYGAFVRSNPGSPLALYALERFAGWDIDADKVEPLFQQLSAGVKKYPSAAAMEDRIGIAKKTGIGRIAMDFTQADTSGVPVSLSSFRGKYLLVDFWASWCGPCRAENPNVVKVFEKYRDRNFHILGVSLDRPGQKERWMKAIHDDKLTWTHVSDLLFWENAVAKQYGIRAIPQNLLLDPEGKIIAKNLRGEDLEARLAELIR